MTPLFFFNHPAPPEIHTLSLHDALPIYCTMREGSAPEQVGTNLPASSARRPRPFSRNLETASASSQTDRKSTRLNSSHVAISYAVFCLKKKKKKKKNIKRHQKRIQ